MTGNTNRRIVFLAAIGLAALAISVGMVSAAGDTEVSVEPANENVTENNVETFAVVVDNATDDVQGFNFTVSLSNGANAAIVGASPGANISSNQAFNANISSDGNSVTVDALMPSQNQVFNSTSPTIVTIDVEGTAAGQTELNTDLASSNSEYVGISASGGDKYNVTASNAASITVVQPQPDFQVSNLDAPSSAVAGETVNVTADVTNDGTVQGTQDVGFSFNGTELANKSVTLNASEVTQVDFSVNTTGTAPGDYQHSIFTDDDSETEQITIVEPQVDFEVSNLSAPSSVDAGETINVTADVTNNGTVQGTQDVGFSFNDTELANKSVTLNASEVTQVDFSVNTSGTTPGNYPHSIFTDDDNETAQITITQPQPDFQVSNLDAPSTVTLGNNVTANATITNQGTAAGTETVEFRVNDTVVDSTSVSLDAGASQSVSLTANTSVLGAGEYTHGIFAGDSNQTNQISIVQTPQANFQLSNEDVPSSVTAGDIVTANVTVTNVGNTNGTQAVEFIFNGSVVNSTSVSLDAGASQSVSLSYDTSGLSPNSYSVVLSADNNITTTVAVNASAPTLPGQSDKAKDLNGDGLFEDINGNGQVNAIDAVTLYQNRNSNAVQDNLAKFDFQTDGNINALDAVTLYQNFA